MRVLCDNKTKTEGDSLQIIYVDTLICINFFIDYIILVTLKRILHIRSMHFRLLLGALFGAVSTLGVFLPFYGVLFSVFYRIITALVTVIISFGIDSLRKLIVRTLTFFGLSMVVCGVVVLIQLTLKPKGVAVYNNRVYFDVSPLFLIISTIFTHIILTLYEKLKGAHKLSCKVRNVTIYIDEKKSISFESAVDTGCSLKEPFSGLPVILVEEEILEGLEIPQEKMRLIPYSTAAGEASVFGFKPKKTLVDGKEIPGGIYAGICKDKLKGEIKSIMGEEI
ncbi:MAG: sigma-E processing peptidase SpoIIGA [Ruminococcus sp.]